MWSPSITAPSIISCAASPPLAVKSLWSLLIAAPRDILARNPRMAYFFRTVPGDPAATGKYAVPVIKSLLNAGKPIFGICLGHQLLSRALGAETEKMHLGHRGANHPVKDLATGKVEITSQNHGFVVKRDSLPDGVSETHHSLFDGSVEGIQLDGKTGFLGAVPPGGLARPAG